MGRPKAKELPLHEIMEYDPESGELYWKVPLGRKMVGEKVGHREPNRYITTRIRGKSYPVHRLAWELYYGEAPKGEIDHINHDKHDNRISNLRDVTRSQNQRNQRRNTKNTSGVTNVYSSGNRWRVYITDPKTQKPFVKRCRNFTDAVMLAYVKRMEFGYHPNHGR